MEHKKKILLLCDHPLVPSGVGTQAKYLIEGLLATGKYKFVVFGGAIRHPNYNPQRVMPEKYGDDGWIIYPVDGYGSKEQLRRTLQEEKPDAVVLFTDPRFFTWVWEMEDEVRRQCPLLYWHVWDNDPTPEFNKIFYDSTDHIACLSLKTFGIMQDLKIDPEKYSYVPHAVAPDIFKPLPEHESAKFKLEKFGPHGNKRFIVFWNNRNARRKLTGDVIGAFSLFAKKVGFDNVALAMHTLVDDPEGQNIIEVAKKYGVEKNMIISQDRVPSDVLNQFYNACDCTVNIAMNEGFGLSTLESLMAGTPIVVNMTGGLQFQIGDWWRGLTDFSDQDKLSAYAQKLYKNSPIGKFHGFHGIPLWPETRSCVGSQQVPYIYEDRVSQQSIADALFSLYATPKEIRKKYGIIASEWARQAFSLDKMISSWDTILSKVNNKNQRTIRSISI